LTNELSGSTNYKNFVRRCKKNVDLGKNGMKQRACIPNMHRFFKWFSMMGKKMQKEVREEIYHETEGDLNLILNEIYQRGTRIGANIDEYTKKLKDATKNIFQRVGRIVYCKSDEGRQPLKEMIASQSGERIDQAKFRHLLFLNLINYQKSIEKYA
jgi:hypothetical protein